MNRKRFFALCVTLLVLATAGSGVAAFDDLARVGRATRRVPAVERDGRRSGGGGALADHAGVVDAAPAGVLDRHPGIARTTCRAGPLGVEAVGRAHEFDEHLAASVRGVWRSSGLGVDHRED